MTDRPEDASHWPPTTDPASAGSGPSPPDNDEPVVDERLLRHLVSSQFPEYRDLPLHAVEPWGSDNSLWRLGADLLVRLTGAPTATGEVNYGTDWLSQLAPHLPIAVPEPIATGVPDDRYPYPWVIDRWLPGVRASPEGLVDPIRFATDLAGTVSQLQSIPTTGAPPARNRARPLADYDDSARRAIDSVKELIDRGAAIELWEAALAAPPYPGPPVWVHGDLEGGCVLVDGRLSGLADWGSGCAGDPAVDVQVAWSALCTDESRRVFLDTLAVDDATRLRSQGVALYEACSTLPYYLDAFPLIVGRCWRKLTALGIRARARS